MLVSPDLTLSRPTSTASSAQLSFRQFTNSDHIQQLNANERLYLANHLAQVSRNQMVWCQEWACWFAASFCLRIQTYPNGVPSRVMEGHCHKKISNLYCPFGLDSSYLSSTTDVSWACTTLRSFDQCIACSTVKPNTTIPETNIAPGNGWLEYYFHFGSRLIFRGYVTFREGTFQSLKYSMYFFLSTRQGNSQNLCYLASRSIVGDTICFCCFLPLFLHLLVVWWNLIL